MSGEEAEKKRSEEVVYQKIEEALLAMPEVSHFTAVGFLSHCIKAVRYRRLPAISRWW